MWLIQLITFLFTFAVFSTGCLASTLFSLPSKGLSPAILYGAGSSTDESMGALEFRNISFVSPTTMLVPYVVESHSGQSACFEVATLSRNANASVTICDFSIAGKKYTAYVPQDGGLEGQVRMTFDGGGELIIAFDLTLIDEDKNAIIMPIYGTTGSLMVPTSIQKKKRKKLTTEGAVGSLSSGDSVQGYLGDRDADGMLDGEFVVVGHMPLDYQPAPGAPFVMRRSFSMNIPVYGSIAGQLPNSKPIYDANSPLFEVIPPSKEKIQ